jgi:hypothetical protein
LKLRKVSEERRTNTFIVEDCPLGACGQKLEADGRLPEHVRAVNSRPMRALEARISRL